MVPSEIPAPALEGEAAAAARTLLDACVAWRAARSDAALTKALTEAESRLRRGPNLRPGEILDRRFVLLEARPPLGIAGRWRAWDLDAGLRVGLRVLHPQHLPDPALSDRFRHAATLQRKAAGPDVAGVVEPDGEWSGFPYIVLAEEGASLADRIGSLAVDDRVPLLLEVVETVERIHRAGLVHGALSPDAVLVRPDGAAVVTDIGLYGGAATGLYVAPEAAAPNAPATRETDAYLVALLALTVLRDAPLPYWVTRDPSDAIAEVGHPEMQAVLQGLLHWKANQRPSVDALAQLLRGDLEHQIGLARRASARGRHALAVTRFRAVVAERPTDRGIRREFAQLLVAAGNDAEAAAALAEAMLLAGQEDGDLHGDLAALKGICDRTGDATPYVATLQALAGEGVPGRHLALLELARFHQDRASDWEAVLATHRTRDHAREALEALTRIAAANNDPRKHVRWGRELHAYVESAIDAAALAHRLGLTYLQNLSDPDNGLLWLDRAHVAGHPDPELPGLVRRLRTDRGEWGQTVELLIVEAEHATDEAATQLLRTASDMARWAAGDAERAAQVDQLVLARGADDDTLRLVARRYAVEGKRDAAARALASLRVPRAEDTCRCIDAFMGIGDVAEATERLRWSRALWPDHVGLLQRALVIGIQSGLEDLSADAAAGIVERVGPGASGRREAQLVLADRARRKGDLVAAARFAQEILVEDDQDSAAWWILVQVAWVAGRLEAQPAWLRAAPKRFPPQEALARLIAGLLEPSAVDGYLAGAGVIVDAQASRLERAGAAVDRLVSTGLVDAVWFDDLVALAGDDDAGWVEAVRRLWYGTNRQDITFPMASAYAWCPPDGADYFKGSRRDPVAGVAPGPTRVSSADGAARSALLVRSTAASKLHADVAGSPDIVRDRRPALVTGESSIPVDGTVFVGTRPGSHLVLSEGPEERCRFERRGDRVYVVADPPVLVDGRSVSEELLADGVIVGVDGSPLRFVADLPADAPLPKVPKTLTEEDTLPSAATVVPEDEIELVREDPTETTLDPDPIRAALFYRHEGAERILPLTGERLVIGPEADATLRVGTGNGWFARIEHPGLGIYQIEVSGIIGPGGPGNPKLLTQGERFTAGGIEFEFQVVEARTPAPPPPRDPPEFKRGDRIPTLFTPEGESITISRDTFTIGRGRRNDLQVANDGKLSRHHCTLVVGPLGVRVRDNNSSNGTMVNGELVDERILGEGDRIQIGDTVLEFRWALTKPIAPMLVEEIDLSIDGDDGMGTMVDSGPQKSRKSSSVTVSDGRTKLQAANEALALVAGALDKVGGAGNGRATIQIVVDATPKRFQQLFAGVEARSTGLPEMVVLYNLAQRPEGAQRTLLNEALLDLVERGISAAVDQISPEEADKLLEDLSETRYREHLRL